MKKLKIYLGSLAILIATMTHGQNIYKTLINDFRQIQGKWTGSLTYLDYNTGQPYTMPADIVVRRLKKTNKFIFSNIYPKENSANSIDTIIIALHGNYINDGLIKSRRQLPNGEIEIITDESGEDGNESRPAIIRHIYTLSKNSFKRRKDVQFTGEKIWIKRHEYSYTRSAGGTEL